MVVRIRSCVQLFLSLSLSLSLPPHPSLSPFADFGELFNGEVIIPFLRANESVTISFHFNLRTEPPITEEVLFEATLNYTKIGKTSLLQWVPSITMLL